MTTNEDEELLPLHTSSDKRQPSNGMDAKPPRWRPPSIFWLCIIIFGALLFAVDIFQSQYDMIPIRITINESILPQDSLKGFLIKTPGCRIPYMDPFDQTVKKFIHKERKPVCNKRLPPLVNSNLTSIYVIKSSISKYITSKSNNTKDLKSLSCCYQPFYRKEPKDDESDNKIRFENKCVYFNMSVNISHEFIRVQCYYNKALVYKDFFSFIPLKINKTDKDRKNKLNVLIIGLDAVSRLNFHRQMPKTVQYLKNISAIELLGYNKVGDNTFPNLIPFLTGLTEKELKKECWNDKHNERFDACPFIWKDFKKRGYVTSFGEDSSWMGIFNYQRRGFKKQPTDYMWGPFNRISEHEIGNSHNMNVEECVGAREVYKVLLSHIYSFVRVMDKANRSYFGFYWGASLSHDYLNKPNQGDTSYKSFFEKLKTDGHLNNTALIFMSDHGIRWGDIRQTYQGQMEERLPFIFMVLPEWFKNQNPDGYSNLLKNTRRLTTPFDMHETLKDFLNFTQEYSSSKKTSRGYSLFSEISPKRTCENAEIASHWCTCQQSIELPKNDSMVLKAAAFAVFYMNHQLEGYAQCSNLTLKNITQSRVMTHGDDIKHGQEIEDYMIILETVPGNGIFEVTVRYQVVKKIENFEVMGTISRLNLYGKQSACITDFHLKLYCYCKSLLGGLDT